MFCESTDMCTKIVIIRIRIIKAIYKYLSTQNVFPAEGIWVYFAFKRQHYKNLHFNSLQVHRKLRLVSAV